MHKLYTNAILNCTAMKIDTYIYISFIFILFIYYNLFVFIYIHIYVCTYTFILYILKPRRNYLSSIHKYINLTTYLIYLIYLHFDLPIHTSIYLFAERIIHVMCK